LIAVRQEHTALRSRHFLHGNREPAPGIFDIAWFNQDGANVPEASWKNPADKLLCLRRATGNADGSVSILSFLLNPTAEDHIFQLPEPVLPGQILINSARANADVLDLEEAKVAVEAHSAMLVYSKIMVRSA
jgi:glycogen operon protein